jgi:hypothetical protein
MIESAPADRLDHDPARAIESASAFLAGEAVDSDVAQVLSTGLAAGGAHWLVCILHERMLSRGQRPERADTRSRRSFERDTGAYMTPDAVAAWMARGHRLPPSELLYVDPACGAGQLLVAAAQHVLQHDADCPDPVALLQTHLRGIEQDHLLALAARVCIRATLWPQNTRRDSFDAVVQCGDGLEYLRAGAQAGPLTPYVVANPPFVGVVERGFDAAGVHAGGAYRVGGTANLAAVFWDAIDAFVGDRGGCTILMPRNLLVSEATRALRASTAEAVSSVWLPASARLFTGADVFVCVLSVDHGRDPHAQPLVWRDRGSKSAPAPPDAEQGVRVPAFAGPDWWAAICGVSSLPRLNVPEWVEVRAGMTTGDAYMVRDYIAEEPASSPSGFPRLLTTGLIDPGVVLWGDATCRYLKGKWQRPVVRAPADSPLWLERIVARSRRPKLIIAGLSSGWELFFDRHGEYAASVGTWTILDRENDISRLEALQAAMEQSPVQAWMDAELGANAMSGGSMTITRGFLETTIPLALANALNGF